ncbi:MAG: DUF1648 domain-containing protein [Candidatus Zipacnadales bacterium]
MPPDFLILAVVLFIVGGMMLYLPVMKGPDAFFGIPVSEEFYRGPVARRYLAIYRLITALLIGGVLVLLFTALQRNHLSPTSFIGVMLVACLGPLVPLICLWRVVKPHELRTELTVPTDASTAPLPEMPPSDRWRYVCPWLEVILLATLLLFTALTVWRYPELPPRIPTHWNAAGRADSWQPKNPFLLLSLLLFLAFFHVMFLTLLVGMARVSFRLPSQHPDQFRTLRESYMRLWANTFNGLRVLLVVLYGSIIWASLFGIDQQAQGHAAPSMILIWVSTAMLLVSLAWAIARSWRLRAQMRKLAGPGFLERTTPTNGWIGGLIYYNKQDPTLWIEKRVGMGWTLNFAHPAAWAMMTVLLVVPLAMVALALSGVTNE